jgi:hypothetical protein
MPEKALKGLDTRGLRPPSLGIRRVSTKLLDTALLLLARHFT